MSTPSANSEYNDRLEAKILADLVGRAAAAAMMYSDVAGSDDALTVPGQQGQQGASGLRGAPGFDGVDGEDPLMSPGPFGSLSPLGEIQNTLGVVNYVMPPNTGVVIAAPYSIPPGCSLSIPPTSRMVIIT